MTRPTTAPRRAHDDRSRDGYQLALQRRTSTEEIGDPIMMHDPTRTTDGIDVTGDPVLNVRRGAYEVSAANRGAGWQSRAAAAVAGAS